MERYNEKRLNALVEIAKVNALLTDLVSDDLRNFKEVHKIKTMLKEVSDLVERDYRCFELEIVQMTNKYEFANEMAKKLKKIAYHQREIEKIVAGV